MVKKEINGKTYVLIQKEPWEMIIGILMMIDRICDEYDSQSCQRKINKHQK